jgi:MFS family permease
VLRSVPKSEFVKAMMMVLVPAQIGPVMGPVVGGFITTYISWRWIFLINAPIGFVGLVCALLFIRNYRESERPPFDWIGFALSFVCLFCILSGLESVGRGVIGWKGTVALLGAGLAFGGWLILHSLRASHPLIDLSLPRIQTFRVNLSAGTLFRSGFGTASFMLPLMFQVVFGMTAFASGLLTFATALGATGSRAMLTRLLKRFGYRNVLSQNCLLYALTVALYALLAPSTPRWLILLVIFFGGVTRMLQNNSLNTLAYADVSPEKMSAATSLAQLAQQLGQVIGIATSVLILQGLMAWHGETHLSLADFRIAFLLIAALTLFSLPEILGLPKNAGHEVSGQGAAALSARGAKALRRSVRS